MTRTWAGHWIAIIELEVIADDEKEALGHVDDILGEHPTIPQYDTIGLYRVFVGPEDSTESELTA